MSWNEMTDQLKAELMKTFTKGNITSLQEMLNSYNRINGIKEVPIDNLKQLVQPTQIRERDYLKWMNRLAKKRGLSLNEMLNDRTYDYKYYYYSNPLEAEKMLNKDNEAHFTDIGKTNYHPTNSDESEVSDPGWQGKWIDDTNYILSKNRALNPDLIDETLDYVGIAEKDKVNVYYPDGSVALPLVFVTPRENYSLLKAKKDGKGYVYSDRNGYANGGNLYETGVPRTVISDPLNNTPQRQSLILKKIELMDAVNGNNNYSTTYNNTLNSIQKARDFQTNWINERRDRFKDQLNDQEYNATINRILNTPVKALYVNPDRPLTEKNNYLGKATFPNTTGSSSTFINSQLPFVLVVMNPKAINNELKSSDITGTIVHELEHADSMSRPINTFTDLNDKEQFSKRLQKVGEITGWGSQPTELNNGYYDRPWEVLSRRALYLYDHNINPNTVFDKKWLKENRKILKDQYNLNYNDDRMLRLFNDVAMNNNPLISNMAAYGGNLFGDGTADINYNIKKGDTLWRISKQLTGDPLNYKKIAEYNDIKNPDKIYAGKSLNIPLELINKILSEENNDKKDTQQKVNKNTTNKADNNTTSKRKKPTKQTVELNKDNSSISIPDTTKTESSEEKRQNIILPDTENNEITPEEIINPTPKNTSLHISIDPFTEALGNDLMMLDNIRSENERNKNKKVFHIH